MCNACSHACNPLWAKKCACIVSWLCGSETVALVVVELKKTNAARVVLDPNKVLYRGRTHSNASLHKKNDTHQVTKLFTYNILPALYPLSKSSSTVISNFLLYC